MAHHKLTTRTVEAARKPGLLGDGAGLYLQVSAGGTKSWVLRYMVAGTPHKLGLGALHTVGLAEARRRAAEARLQVLDGKDPIAARKQRRAAVKVEAAKAVTFAECAELYIAANEAAWRNAKHRAQWRSSLATYTFPVFGELPVAAIDTGLVLRVLEPIWAEKHQTAVRVRGRIEAVLNWATVREYRAGDNPARWRGHLQNALSRRPIAARVKHHDAAPCDALPELMAQLRANDCLSARALELTVLTSARTSEVIEARWCEFDLNAGLWTVPAERMKAGAEHRVPLSSRARDLLASLPRVSDSAYVFPGARRGRPLSNMAMLELLRGMRGRGATVHGFRSTFRDWAAERTAYPSDVVELALAHTVRNKVEAAYRRGDLLEKRARLMAEWAVFCETIPAAAAGKVVVLRAAHV